jgi:two-component system, cell cycle sensor histidine kinase and response regulator CckA
MTLRILLLEDIPSDAELAELALRKAGLEFASCRVMSRADFERELADFAPDLIIADHNLPQFSGAQALELARKLAPAVPFILLTGSLDEETAVEYMKAGAADYILKDRLARLGPAAKSALERQRTAERMDWLSHAVEQSPAAVLITDTGGVIQYVNQRFTDVTGYAPDQVLGRTPRILSSGRTPPETYERLWATITAGETWEGELQNRRKNGELYWDHSIISPLRDAGGVITHFLGVQEEITERKRMEQQLREREEYFRSLIEQAQDIIAVVDAEGGMRYASPSVRALLGYAPEELIGRGMFELVHPDDAETTLRVFAEGVATGKGGRLLDVRFRHKDGTYRILEAIGRYLVNDPLVHGVVINARDVTERRSLERQLVQAQKMEAVGRLAGGVAHDFNNVLTAILGYAGLLLDGLPTLSPLRPDLEEIRKAADRAAGLTRQLLAFSRKQVLELRVLDLNELVADIERLLKRLLGEDIDVVTNLDPALGTVRGDAGQLEQVLVNLAVNARDAMPQGGRLTIETRNAELDESYAREHVPVQPGRYVMLAVSDTGTGMSAEILSHVFEPFFTTKEPGKGTGLGLATVYGIVKQSGGYVWCYSEPGQGTTFKVYLPRVDAPADRFPSRAAVRPTHGSETILLVEDDAGLRALTRRLLEKHGYTVLEAPTAVAALALARDHAGPMHLLLADVVLPGASGRTLADELRGRRADLKVLFMSGYTEDAIVHRGVLPPHAAFIHKPFSADRLAEKVREVLDTS